MCWGKVVGQRKGKRFCGCNWATESGGAGSIDLVCCLATPAPRPCAAPQVSAAALQLFAFGQEQAAKRGLLLVDTKYEFGKVRRGGRARTHWGCRGRLRGAYQFMPDVCPLPWLMQ